MSNEKNIGHLCGSCGTAVPSNAPGGMCPNCLLKQGLSEITDSLQEHAVFETPSLAAMKERFPQLEILEFVGRGGMGVVYKARQPQLNRIVAVKILPIAAESHPEFSQRFLREAQALARLNHPNIVTIHDFGETDGLCYFIMEFVEGETLRELISAGRIPPEKATSIAIAVCDALQYAHDHGVVHRDITPGNILVEQSGRVKIADFGLAKLLISDLPDITLTMSNESMGTPYYMAPEQHDPARDTDHRADIYSLGVLLYEMLTGTLPVGIFEPASKKVPVNHRIDAIIIRALKADVELRYQQASEMKADLDKLTKSGLMLSGSALRMSSDLVTLIYAALILGAFLSFIWFFKQQHIPVPSDAVGFRGNYYKVYYENVDWHEAHRRCERMGGDLAVVNSKAEDDFLAALSRNHVWLGATDEQRQGTWKWIDGRDLSYSNWDYGEPNNAIDPKTGEREHYLMLTKYGKWNDLALNSQLINGFICEWDGSKHQGPKRIGTADDLQAALRRTNPGYNGKGIIDMKDGAIIGLTLENDGIADLTPLRGIPLSSLNVSWSDVTNLSPLENMPLKILDISRCKADDISPLAGMSLTQLKMEGTLIRDISALRGMPLTYLDISHSKVTDLTPLNGMALEVLHMNCIKVTDISALASMPLKRIGLLDTPISDLSPLENCKQLESIVVPTIIKNLDVLKCLPNLKLVNNKRPSEFWQELQTDTNRVPEL